jgi:hypothetical protein
LAAYSDVYAVLVLADTVTQLADGVIVEARWAAAFSDGAPERTLRPLAKRGRVERLAEVAREEQIDAIGAQVDVFHEIGGAFDLDVGPVDRTAETEAPVLSRPLH